ncbi:hypothetical protein KG112_09940 [Nocardioides sp. zg-ZUI104]|uniref:hypothetical protein n=1 Tax=Nocardioides faecalis TaxID=2803858 RepID=UPI001BD06F85|nr:hypothetical protein [Nocardioides faecalis]MBS4753122.1 hypothetical protein [Nocardioides faecalis]
MTRVPTWWLPVVVGAVVIAALLTVLTSPGRAEPPAGSPEEGVQRYLDAVLDDDPEAAAVYLAPGGECSVTDLENAYVEDVRITLRDVRTTGDSARVEVSIVSRGGGLLSTTWTEQHVFQLRRDDDHWLFTGTPWPMYYCEAESGTEPGIARGTASGTRR